MMSLFLVKMDAAQIILIVFIALLVIGYPILISRRNKKENTKLQEQTNSLKRGDKVLTTSGVYGTIVDLQLENDKKIVTIETGTEKKKGYISVDAYAIYTVFPDEKELARQQAEAAAKAKENEKAEPAKADNKPAEAKEQPAEVENKSSEVMPVEEKKANESKADKSVEDVKAQISGKKKKHKKQA